MRIEELKIDEEFQKLIPPLSEDEYRYLKESIAEEGIREPITVWNGTVIDGHNRVKICKELGIMEIKVYEKHFKNKDDVIWWMLRNQLGRRNLTDHQRNEIALKYEDIIAAKMKERQLAGLKRGTESPLRPKEPNGEPKTSKRKELAKIAGTSEGSIQRSKLILEHGTEEQKKRAENGESISKIAKEIREGMKPKSEPQNPPERDNSGAIPEGMKECSWCGKILPVSEFNIDHRTGKLYARCKKCNSLSGVPSKYRSEVKNMSPEVMGMTEEMVVSDLYDTEKERPYTNEDLKDELTSLLDDFESKFKTCLYIHADIVETEQGKMVVVNGIKELAKSMEDISAKLNARGK